MLGLRTFGAAAVLGVLALGATAARADFQPLLDNVTDNLNGTFTYNYELDFNTNGAGPNQILEGSGGAQGFATIYDIGKSANVIAVNTPGSFTSTMMNIGITPMGVSPMTGDDPTLQNVTFSYTGPTVTTAQNFTGFQLTIRGPGLTQVGSFTDRVTNNLSGLQGTPVVSGGNVLVPQAVPEPASLALLAIGGLGIIGIVRRRARA
jgi:hypothetical protein